ncbi:hypothetical protein SAMN05444679_10392 [Variovorax sp. CF079]|uniref:hypothetical protein n=1 Tax=Variovorax sp. CF079 TaxID=1882774 RepID=UPI000889D7EC|nr:hypothetical protein [Variovorax sp. CF079]SDC44791.1 hypothetical protein SAMN05444679_10392 [Variovorax sp. CF079]
MRDHTYAWAGAESVTVSICTRRTPLLRQAILQVLVVIDVFRGDRVNLSKKYDYPCLQRLAARLRFNEGLPPGLADQVVEQFCNEHSERYLLAFAYGYLGEHDLLSVRNDAEKFLLLAVLNLVECIALVGTQPPSD